MYCSLFIMCVVLPCAKHLKKSLCHAEVRPLFTCSIAQALSSLVIPKYIRSRYFRIRNVILNMYKNAFIAHNILPAASQDVNLKLKYKILYVNAASTSKSSMYKRMS